MIDTILKLVYFAGLAVILYLALAPNPPAPVEASDKINHMLAFLALSLGGRVIWRGLSVWTLLAAMAVLGAGIELLQLAMGLGRDADVMDWIADMVATVAGLAIGTVVVMIVRRAK
ncbi:teicoplanin resistance protein VanZ [Novosphingobium sp. H3SJ31-1]|uniref:Teicoplanin resistance protein VanZ n=1 Tax=Novosphingobium album (ex Liu et al. 2023) TaxID=3031130 RepID=A0ABT5WW83_9SPHN|nr:teicoplanin resistance protein VanZ [Novosphingobium album (ex Liu et al. 2023)]